MKLRRTRKGEYVVVLNRRLFLLLLVFLERGIIEVGGEGVESSDDLLVCIMLCQRLVICSFDIWVGYRCILI